MLRNIIFSFVLGSIVILPKVFASNCSDDDSESISPIVPFKAVLALAHVYQNGKTDFSRKIVALPKSKWTFTLENAEKESGLVALGVLLHSDPSPVSSEVSGDGYAEEMMSRIYVGQDHAQTINWDRILYKFPRALLSPKVSIRFDQSEVFSDVIEMRVGVKDDFECHAEPMLIDLDGSAHWISISKLKQYLTEEEVLKSYQKPEHSPLDIGSCLTRPLEKSSDLLNGLYVSVKLLNLVTMHSQPIKFDFDHLPMSWHESDIFRAQHIGEIYPLLDRVQFVLEFRSEDGGVYEVMPLSRGWFSLENTSVDRAYVGLSFFLNVQPSQMFLKVYVDSVSISNKQMSSEFKTELYGVSWRLPLFNFKNIAQYVDQDALGLKVIRVSH